MIKLNASAKATIYVAIQYAMATSWPFNPWAWAAVCALTLLGVCQGMTWSYRHKELSVDFDEGTIRGVFVGLMIGAMLGAMSGAALGVATGVLK